MSELEPITRAEKFLNGEVGMTPITREEKILAGEDVETITRREYFLKKYRGGGGGDVTVVPLSVTENGTYSEEGKAYSPVNVNVPLPPNAYLLKSVPNLPQPIATFKDGADAPMKSLKVAIEPQQDLHGYGGPWAGGAGKNKLVLTPNAGQSFTINGITWTVNLDGSVKVQGTATARSVFYYFPISQEGFSLNGTYKLFKNNEANNVSVAARIGESWYTFYPTGGSGYTLDNVKLDQMWMDVQSGITVNIIVYPMICLSSVTDTTWEPYSNICPIEGHTEANITVADDDTDPTVSNIYTIDLDGTHYGGEVDVVNGGGTDTLRYVDLGSVDYIKDTASGYTFFRHSFADKAQNFNFICSQYRTVEKARGDLADGDIGAYNLSNAMNNLCIRDDAKADMTVAEFKTTMNGVQLVYELATPTTYDTQPTPVKSLEGENNVWADTGDITDAEYFSKEV